MNQLTEVADEDHSI